MGIYFDDKPVVACLIFNRLEIHTVKIRIVEQFPDSKKLYHVTRTHPVLYDEPRIVGIAIFCNVGKRDILIPEVFGIDGYL